MENEIQIKIASSNDLSFIESWLIEEKKKSSNDFKGFYCNWKVIKSSYEENNLFVLLLNTKAIGILSLDNFNPNILEIHPDYRGKGYGKRLAEWAVTNAFNNNVNILEIECEPQSSRFFWEKLGFQIFEAETFTRPLFKASKILTHI